MAGFFDRLLRGQIGERACGLLMHPLENACGLTKMNLGLSGMVVLLSGFYQWGIFKLTYSNPFIINDSVTHSFKMRPILAFQDLKVKWRRQTLNEVITRRAVR